MHEQTTLDDYTIVQLLERGLAGFPKNSTLPLGPLWMYHFPSSGGTHGVDEYSHPQLSDSPQ